MQRIKKYFVVPIFTLLLVGVGVADTTSNTSDNLKLEDNAATQSCSAKTSDCNFGSNWELFKQNVSDAASSGTKAAKDVANKAHDYAKEGWGKTKSATTEGWQNTKDMSNTAWEKTKQVAADGWRNTKEVAQKGSDEIDNYFNADKNNENAGQELDKPKNQGKSQ